MKHRLRGLLVLVLIFFAFAVLDTSVFAAADETKVEGTAIMLINKDGNGEVDYTFQTPVQTGQRFAGTLEFSKAQQVWIGVFGVKDGKQTQIFADNTNSIRYTIDWPAKANWDALRLLVVFRDNTVDWSQNTVKVENFRIVSSDIAEVGSNGAVTIKNIDGNNNAEYTYQSKVQSGQKVVGTVKFSQAQQLWLGVFGIKDGKETEIWADNTSDGTYNMSFVAKADYDALRVLVAFRDNTIDWSQNVITIQNFKVVSSDQVIVESDGTVVIQNLDGDNTISYTFRKQAKAGKVLKFNLDIAPSNQKANFWILGCDTTADGWTKEWYGDGVTTWKDTHSFRVSVKEDTEVFTLYVRFESTDVNLANNVVTLSGINIEAADDETTVTSSGTVSVQDFSDDRQVSYTFEQETQVGQVLSFDLDISPTGQKVIFYVLGCDFKEEGWVNELYKEEVTSWFGKKTVTIELTEKRSVFTIVVQFDKNMEIDAGLNVAKIRNIHVSEDVTTHEETHDDAQNDAEQKKATKGGTQMKSKIIIIAIIAVLGCTVLCACAKKNNSEQKDTENTQNVVDGKMYITEEMKAELDTFVGVIDSVDEKSKAEVSILTNARAYTVTAALEIKWTSCNITSLEKVDDYNYQITAKVFGTDAMGEDVEIEFTGNYYFEEDESKTDGYKLIELYTDLSSKIGEIKGWL